MNDKVVSEKKNKGERTPFPGVFWVANQIEVLERFAYYGIYMGFGVYMSSLGFSRGQLGVVQTIFLFMIQKSVNRCLSGLPASHTSSPCYKNFFGYCLDHAHHRTGSWNI